MFKTSVFPVPPGAERRVTLQYNQLLRKDHALTDFLFPLSTAKYTSKPVERLEFRASIESTVEIKNVYSPTHAVNVKRPSKTNAVVSFEAKNQVPTSDFRLLYSVAKGKLGANVLSFRPDKGEDGFFLLLASPQFKDAAAERPKKTVVCVFDRSGSMSGKKIEQAREALRFVLNNLRQGDLFNIVAYDSNVETFRPELERYNDETRRQALGFVEGMYAGGGTNIHGALTTSLKMLKDKSRPNYLIFMTDGLPTMGETNEPRIVEEVQKANEVRARVISFGVGYDVNSRLLDRISRTNFGQSEFVRPNEDIEEHVSRLYSRISSPVLTAVKVHFEFDALPIEAGPPINRFYPRDSHDLFEGEQLVVVGRYKKPGVAKVKITGEVDGKAQKFDFPANLVEESPDESYAFIEKLWAMRRIGEIIDEMDLHGKNDELVKELVQLSTKHGILTPYTSFLADENAAPADLADTRRSASRASDLLGRLEESEGQAAFAQREAKNEFRRAVRAAPAPTRPMAADSPGDAASAEEPPALSIAGGAVLRDIDRDKDVSVQAVQLVGNKVLYKRGNVWYEFDVTQKAGADLAAKAKVIERFTQAYFDMVRKASPAQAKILAAQPAGEELMLEVDGDVYHVK
jgi:Ca-activated chloride channel family protein